VAARRTTGRRCSARLARAHRRDLHPRPGLFDAYLSPWTPSAKLLEPDGFRTGDQGYFDADGVLFLAGRRHNRINMAA
jgi:acyl-CoA synthetase (AMP-forming)/AMP-acid ligase II